MGGAPSSGFSYPNNIPSIYNKDLAISYEVISSLLSRDIGQSYNLGLALPNQTIQDLQILFPEFTFTNIRYNLFKATRFTYLGSPSVCCVNTENYYLFNGSYITCPRSMKIVDRVCDATLSSYCFLTNVPNKLTHVCRKWLDDYIKLRGFDVFTISGYQYCDTPDKRTANKFCDIYLTVMRSNPDSSFHDLWLKRERFSCDSSLRQSKQSSTIPRVCWDPKCVNSPLWQLKYSDYITRLNCQVSSSDINYSVSDINTSRYIKTFNSTVINTITDKGNVYKPYLQRIGRLFIDFMSVTSLVFISVLVVI